MQDTKGNPKMDKVKQALEQGRLYAEGFGNAENVKLFDDALRDIAKRKPVR